MGWLLRTCVVQFPQLATQFAHHETKHENHDKQGNHERKYRPIDDEFLVFQAAPLCTHVHYIVDVSIAQVDCDRRE